MEDTTLREKVNYAKDCFVKKIQNNKKCLAAFLIGSVSHDLIWEWSDLQILAIFDDNYKGLSNYNLIEHEIPIVVDIKKKSEFISYLGSTNMTDYYFCALSKSTTLFIKDPAIKECFEDSFYIGDRDREIEMLLGFSNAVYYMNKAEKNFKIKGNSENAVYFLLEVAKGIAWLEVARQKMFPEREIIAQAKKINPKLFSQIYDCMFYEPVTDSMIERIIEINLNYLKDNTKEVYKPILSHLAKYGNLDKFSMPTRPHGFGIDFLWLYRMGILEREIQNVKIDSQNDEIFGFKYVLSEQYQLKMREETF